MTEQTTKKLENICVGGGGGGHNCKSCCVSCNLHHALEVLAHHALKGRYPKEEMPYKNIEILKQQSK